MLEVFLAHPQPMLSAVAAGLLVGVSLTFWRMVRQRHAHLEAATSRMRPVLKGQIAEQFAPYLADDFHWSAADARFLGSPIDYVVFDGYAGDGEVEVILVEVKTGKSKLSAGQRRIRRAVKAGRVRWATVRL